MRLKKGRFYLRISIISFCIFLITAGLNKSYASDSQSWIDQLIGALYWNSVVNTNPKLDTTGKHNAIPYVIDMHADTASAMPPDDRVELTVCSSEEGTIGNHFQGMLGVLNGCELPENPDYMLTVKRIARTTEPTGHVDLPRLVKGNVFLQVFSAPNWGMSADSAHELLSPYWTFRVEGLGSENFSYREWVRAPQRPEFGEIPYAEGRTRAYEESWWAIPRQPSQYGYKQAQYSCDYWFAKTFDQYGVGSWPANIADWGANELGLEADDGFSQHCHECQAADGTPKTCECIKNIEHRVSQHLTEAATKSIDEFNGCLAYKNAEDCYGFSSQHNKFMVIRSLDDLHNLAIERNSHSTKNVVGALLSTEGLYREFNRNNGNNPAIGAYFNELYDLGYRMFSLTHFTDSDFAGSSVGAGRLTETPPVNTHLGLSPAGNQMIDILLANPVIVDVAHLSMEGITQVVAKAKLAGKPIVYSHGGLRALTNGNQRNLASPQIKEIADTGGVIGIGYSNDFVGGYDVIDIAKAIRYAVDYLMSNGYSRAQAVASVGLGSDYDGGIAAIMTANNLSALTRCLTCTYNYWTSPDCLHESNYYPQNFTESEVRLIMGGNTMRVFKQTLPCLSTNPQVDCAIP